MNYRFYRLLHRVAVATFVFVLLFVMVSVTPGLSMTLDEAIDLALKNNPDLQKQMWNKQLAEEDVSGLNAQNFGQLNIVSSYNHYNLPRTLVPMTPAAMQSNPAGIATTQDLLNTAIVYEVELFNGFQQTRSIEASQLQKEMAIATLKLSREQLIYNVKSLYVNILSLQAQHQAQQNYVDALQRLYEDVQFKYKLGKLARIDVLKAEADLRNGQGQLVQIGANITILKGSLATLLGRSTVGNLAAVDLPIDGVMSIHSDSKLQLENLQRLKNAQRAVEKRQKEVDVVSGSLYPRIAFSSSYGINYGPNDSDNLNSGDWENETVWQVGLNLSWNIFDFDRSRSKIRKAQILERQSRHDKIKIELEVKRSIDEAMTKVNSALSDYQTRLSEVTLTREAEKIEQVRFDQGAVDINDLLYTKARNLLAESRFISAGYSCQIARFYLDYLLEQGETR
ncbi:MAG: TolC family protein [Desulfuromusa sp.]|nr:TolC family protein [Desulfuromusa sp.]